MKYLQMFIWKLLYWIIGIIIVVGGLILSMQVSKMYTDLIILQLIMAVIMWMVGGYIILKPLSMLDRFFVNKALLNKDALLYFFLFMAFVIISLGVFLASIYLFKEWLELINDTVHRTLDDYFTIIFPLVLLIASIASLKGSFKLYETYKNKLK